MSTSSTFLEQFYIPNYILNLDSQPEALSDAPECPVIVFINSKSGGQLGGNLLVTYRSLLNENQVNLVNVCISTLNVGLLYFSTLIYLKFSSFYIKACNSLRHVHNKLPNSR